jgi:hypothetical protein
MKTRNLLLLFIGLHLSLFAQEGVPDESIRIPMINLNAGFHIPGGDLDERFGNSALFGIGFQLKNKNNFYWGVDASGLTGSNIIEDDIINIISADSIDIIDVNGNTASIRFWERGAHAQFVVGKIIPVLESNNNSGFFVQAGLGYMYHKIRIEDIGNQSPQLNSEMLKGYDRLSMGVSISEFIGYRYFSSQQKINFFIGFEFIQAFTQDVRQYDYNAQTAYQDSRLDLLSGLKFGWTFPLYKKSDNKYYYY